MTTDSAPGLARVPEACVLPTVRDLARRENGCCSFFDFTVASPEPGRVVFDIEVPPAQAEVLDALAARVPERRRR